MSTDLEEEKIVINLEGEPRDYQLPLVWDFQEEGLLRACCVWHRRSGKDTTALNLCIEKMFERKGGYYHFFPVGSQGRKAMWEGINRDGKRYMDYFPSKMIRRKNDQEMRIELHSGSYYQIVGVDRALDWIVGTNPVGCIFSEWALMNPAAWDLIRPILRENGGWAIFIYTARGENHGFDLAEMAKKNPNWHFSLLTVDDTKRPDGTPVISEKDIQEERDEGMSDEMIEQEYYCSFEGSVPGAYFGKEMKRAKALKRITSVPYEPAVLVDTWWDLGVDDSMSIWFTQSVGSSIRCIDYYENSGFGFGHYAKELKDRADKEGYIYGTHNAPHDITVRELGATEVAQSRQETARSLGIDFIAGKRVQKKEDAIEAVRQTISKCWFDDAKCKQGIACLRNYKSEYDDKKRVKKKVPVHDWASHGSDSFMEMAMHYRPPLSGKRQEYAEA